ncbi:MAG: helix-turn-helix transcriptional regulator [Chloroflexaceae bacterium]|nr:helix-turn-helix transcriptional regulator [Chloroflexaceae bacterium]NJL33640.1 helix-turn-helix transcriptional regulator [Chloroflexaceae bacterium]NJO04714.1 helix-turn-helix transcriptional regulator [Chloroflexaceae bacterium]
MQSLNDRLAEVLKRKRQRYRFTQAALGTRIGVSGSYISSLESGQSSARISELEALAVEFQTTAIELLNEAAASEVKYNFSSSNREREAFVSLYDMLNEEQRKLAHEFMLFLRQRQSRPPGELSE